MPAMHVHGMREPGVWDLECWPRPAQSTADNHSHLAKFVIMDADIIAASCWGALVHTEGVPGRANVRVQLLRAHKVLQ